MKEDSELSETSDDITSDSCAVSEMLFIVLIVTHSTAIQCQF